MHIVRRLTVASLSLFLAGFAMVGTSGTAHAEDAFQYWSYWQLTDKGTFDYAPKGAADTKPADGSVEGHRWSATPMGSTNVPRADLDEVNFDTICADSDAADGEKRVAVIVDFGLEADAIGGDETPEPFAACAVVPVDASGLQVLDAVADVRTKQTSGGTLLCGIDGYPSTSCADHTTPDATPEDETVDVAIRGAADTEASSDSAADDDDSNLPLLVTAGVVVLALAAGGVVLARRGRSAA